MKVCAWCGITIRWWRRYCDECGPRIKGEAGIYLQSGGPPYPYMSRVRCESCGHPANDPAIVYEDDLDGRPTHVGPCIDPLHKGREPNEVWRSIANYLRWLVTHPKDCHGCQACKG